MVHHDEKELVRNKELVLAIINMEVRDKLLRTTYHREAGWLESGIKTKRFGLLRD